MTGGFHVCACVFKQCLTCVTIIGIFENISTYTMILPEKILHFYSLLIVIFFLSFKKSIIIIHDLISFSLSEDFLSEIRHRIYVKVDLTNHYPLLLHTAHRTATTNCSYSTIFQIRRLEFRNVKPVRNYFYSYIYTTCHF